MAHNVQSVTLSLTLPISCQICLGKVREPVICGNYHVFCSSCIDVWLKKASQCPTCRISITAENPCRKIIGATNESESNESQSIKRHLRKARAELLLREYEDEIEGLQKENEELRNKNSSIEGQLQALLHPSTLCSSPKTKQLDRNGEEKRIDPHILEEWTNKLRAATDISEKVKLDMEKLKEANKTLRSQNIDLVRDNLRLKAEVENRSPQKFGRYTVAALEAKISQYERDLLHLRRALERSDKYIEELEGQLSDSEGKLGVTEASGRLHEAALAGAADGTCQTKDGVIGGNCDDAKEQRRIVTMRRSLSAMEEASVCTDLDRRPVGFSGPCRFLLTTSSKPAMSGTVCSVGQTGGDSTPEKGQQNSAPHHGLPSTPSSSFSCLSLESPGVKGSKRTGFRPLSYLRRLSFEDCSGTAFPMAGNEITDAPGIGDCLSVEPGKLGFWGVQLCKPKSQGLTLSMQTEEQPKGHNRGGELTLGGESGVEAEPDAVPFGMSSEDSMNAAYLDKVSELDSMISECESGRGSRSPPTSAEPSGEPSGFGASLVPGVDCCEELSGTSSAGSEANATRGRGAEEMTFDSPLAPHGSLGMEPAPLALPVVPDVGLDASEPEIAQDTEGKTDSIQRPKRKSQSGFNFASPSKISKFE
ncbi:ORC ubiquitin ligase 1 [Anguilla rostrata]|uniref:ORC ubiquitin ligase 1 n=1 Tax=Anguilla rostrata TaxID=7938 RepID=UPI0030D41176